MDTKEIVKWAVIIIVGWFLLQWLINAFSSGPADLGGFSFYPAYYAAPLTQHPSAVYGWEPPWQYGRKRGRR